ncbi:hypothetical protein OROGR_021181 [Orobanche gracilis]
MKRAYAEGGPHFSSIGPSVAAAVGGHKKMKHGEEKLDEIPNAVEAVLLDENLLYEVLRHVDDGRTLAKAACVSRQWGRTAHDERLWEQICTMHYQRSPMQLRAVVLALGGFRRLYSSHLWPLLKPGALLSLAPPAVSTWPCLHPAPPPAPGASSSKARWGKDEVPTVRDQLVDQLGRR